MLARSVFNYPGMGHSPFIEFEKMRRQMESLSSTLFGNQAGFRHVAAGVFPLSNLTEDPDNYYVRAELPGMKAEDLNIQIVGKSLTVSGERKIASEEGNVRYHRREREAGRFSRGISLPGRVESGKVEARMENGILTIVIPKAEDEKPRQITIH